MDWKDQYSKMLGCVDPSDLRIEEAQQLKMVNLPGMLYKFRPPTNYAIDNLEQDTVWLNKPSEYNDPFEFAEHIDFDKIYNTYNELNREEVISMIASKQTLPDDVLKTIREAANPLRAATEYQLAFLGQKNPDETTVLIDLIEQALKQQFKNNHQKKISFFQDAMKVCSFCESPNHLLMWGHYTHNYTGFCIEYNIHKWAKDDIRKRMLYPVIYSQNLYEATDHFLQHIHTESFNVLYPILSGSTKSKEWLYEQEWRFIFNIGPDFPQQNYFMDCQSKVFIGFRMPEAIQKKIIEICKQKELAVYLAKPSGYKYELDFQQIL
jgi:hypothetical protein